MCSRILIDSQLLSEKGQSHFPLEFFSPVFFWRERIRPPIDIISLKILCVAKSWAGGGGGGLTHRPKPNSAPPQNRGGIAATSPRPTTRATGWPPPSMRRCGASSSTTSASPAAPPPGGGGEKSAPKGKLRSLIPLQKNIGSLTSKESPRPPLQERARGRGHRPIEAALVHPLGSDLPPLVG